MDYSAMMRMGGGMLSGIGQGMMDRGMRQSYGAARTGGFRDLMENQDVGDFIKGGVRPDLLTRYQDLKARMQPAMRGVPSGMPGTGATGYNQ